MNFNAAAHKVILESDSIEVCKLMREDDPLLHSDHFLIKKCHGLLVNTNWTVDIFHIRWQANGVADELPNLLYY